MFALLISDLLTTILLRVIISSSDVVLLVMSLQNSSKIRFMTIRWTSSVLEF